MSPQRTNTRDNPTLEGSARVCVAGSPVPPLWALGLAVLTLLLSAILALVPFGIHVGISETCDSTNKTRGVYLERYEAMAATLTPGDTAKEFIKKMAAGAGMAAGDFITATLGIAAVGSGMALASSQGQQWGMEAADAVANVVEAADYPDYDTLTSEQQTLWGSKENYDSAKYVSLMHGLGFGTEYERFEQFQASGGGNFEFEDDVQDRLNQVKRIGSLWQSRLGVMFGDIQGMISNMEVINAFPAVGSGTGVLVFDGSEEQGWPDSIPERVNIGYSDELRTAGVNARDTVTKNYYKLSTPQYFLIFAYPNGSWINTTGGAFSEETFNWGLSYSDSPPATNSAATLRPNNGGIYTTNVSLSVGVASKAWDMSLPYNYVESSVSQTAYVKAMQIILSKGVESGTTGEADSIVDYPDGDVSNDQRIYYPENGVTPDTTWNQFTTPQTPIRDNETPYNPGNQTQTPEWQTQTEENVLPLLDIKFDKLFPFSMLSDIPKLFDKVELLTGTQAASGVYNRVEIPMNWGQNHEDVIVLDLAWLHDLLNMIRPAMQVLLVAFLLITCIEFWRGILTG